MSSAAAAKDPAETSSSATSSGSLLVLVLDVNPYQRPFLSGGSRHHQPHHHHHHHHHHHQEQNHQHQEVAGGDVVGGRLGRWLDAALILVNSHLMLDAENEAAVVGVARNSCDYLYPLGDDDVGDPRAVPAAGYVVDDGQFEGFRTVERTVRKNVLAMLGKELCPTQELRPSPNNDSLVAGGLCKALAFINRRLLKRDIRVMGGSGPDEGLRGQPLAAAAAGAKKARILVMTASGATASQYMDYMNTFFTAQKVGVPVDTCIMDRDSGLLQQGADITGGLYVKVPNLDCLLQFLVWIFLPGSEAGGGSGRRPAGGGADNSDLRKQLGMPVPAKVDYRAACFCHRQLVDVGFVCSVCLSIFAKFSPICTTCQTVFKNPAITAAVAMANGSKKKKAKAS